MYVVAWRLGFPSPFMTRKPSTNLKGACVGIRADTLGLLIKIEENV